MSVTDKPVTVVMFFPGIKTIREKLIEVNNIVKEFDILDFKFKNKDFGEEEKKIILKTIDETNKLLESEEERLDFIFMTYNPAAVDFLKELEYNNVILTVPCEDLLNNDVYIKAAIEDEENLFGLTKENIKSVCEEAGKSVMEFSKTVISTDAMDTTIGNYTFGNLKDYTLNLIGYFDAQEGLEKDDEPVFEEDDDDDTDPNEEEEE